MSDSDSDPGSGFTSDSHSESAHDEAHPVAPPGQGASIEHYEKVSFIFLLILIFPLM